MSDNGQVQHIGLFQRIKSAILGVGIGLMMILVSVPLTFWNEWTAVSAYQALQEGAGLVVSVPSDRVDGRYEGKLVHVSDTVKVPGPLKDPTFGVSVDGATRLKRTVEMYQWKEHKKTETRKKLGGGEERVTTFTYEQTWADRVLSSKNFDDRAHVNPASMPFESETYDQPSATLGAFTLDRRAIERLSNFKAVKVTANAVSHVAPGSAADLSVHEGDLFRGADPATPAIGDVRIRFQKAPAARTTVVAKQTGAGFAPYTTANGRELDFIRIGEVSAERIFDDAVSANNVATWCVRLGAFFMLFSGLRASFGPLAVITDIVPFAGRIVRRGLTTLSFFISAPLMLILIAVAWIVARPLLGIALLLAAGALVVGLLVLLGIGSRRKLA